MDIDVMDWIRRRITTTLVTADEALPGRDEPVLLPMPQHAIFSRPLDEVPEDCEVAYFALGCYWGAERLFWTTKGVVNTAAGFMGGFTPNPTYYESCTGQTGHTETVRVVFDPQVVTYPALLQIFWEAHDPTQANRQGNDIGTQYRSALFPVNAAQLTSAIQTRTLFQRALSAAGYGEITTQIQEGARFYYAELEHQQYLHKNPDGYACDHRTGVSCAPVDG